MAKKSTSTRTRKSTSVSATPKKESTVATQVQVTPAAEAANESKPKSNKVDFPVPENKDDKIELEVGATEMVWPDDFDQEKHKPLKKKHFKSVTGYLTYRALMAEQSAAEFRKDAEEWKSNAGKKRFESKAKRVKKQLADLRKQMADMGMTEDEINATLATE